MKILDPQSAVLTNTEVFQFLRANPPRKPDKAIGAYTTTNLQGYNTIRKEFNRYTDEIAPHLRTHARIDTWISELITNLKPYDLTKSEVLNLIDMGVGKRAAKTQEIGDDEAEAEAEAEPDDEAEMARDVQFFRVAVEEADERFPAEATIREIVRVLKDTIKSTGEEG